MKSFMALALTSGVVFSVVGSFIGRAQADGRYDRAVRASDIPLTSSDGVRAFYDTLGRDGK